MVQLRQETDLGGSHRVIGRQKQFQTEQTTFGIKQGRSKKIKNQNQNQNQNKS
jgi:hypothetical protein